MSLFETELVGRQWLRVGDSYEITKKPRNLDRSAYAQMPFAPMESIPQDGSYLPDFTHRPPSTITSGTYFERGDVLVSKITPSFENGKQAWITELVTPFGYATTEVFPLRPKSTGHDPRFLFFYLLHPDIRHYLAERMEGTTGRQRIPESTLLDLPIPVIEKDEQRGIGVALEVIQRARHIESLAEQAGQRLKHSTMGVLFTRGLRGEAQKETEIGSAPESWDVTPLGRHHIVVSGGTPSRANPRYWESGTIPWVKTAEVDYGVIVETEERITLDALKESTAKLLPKDSLLLAMYGQGVTRGKVAMLGIEAACNQACAAIRPKDSAVLPRYLYHFLTYRYDDIRSLAHGGQQQNLNLEIVRALPIAFPVNRRQQEDIVALLDALDCMIDLHVRRRAIIDGLFNALLHRLMTREIRVTDLDLSVLTQVAEAETAA